MTDTTTETVRIPRVEIIGPYSEWPRRRRATWMAPAILAAVGLTAAGAINFATNLI